MNDEETQYEELRWLARDARQERSKAVRRTGAWALGAAALTTFFVANQATQTDPTEPTNQHAEIIRLLTVNEAGINRLIGRREINLSEVQDSLGRLEDAVGRIRFDRSDRTRNQIYGLLDQLGDEISDIDLTIEGGDSRMILQMFAEGPSRATWRVYPMYPGDSLWIPDGDFYVSLRAPIPAGRESIFMDVYLRGQRSQSPSSWTRLLAAGQPAVTQVPKELGNPAAGVYFVKLYYARDSSTRPGFEGRGFVDIAICWSDESPNRCDEEVDLRLL